MITGRNCSGLSLLTVLILTTYTWGLVFTKSTYPVNYPIKRGDIISAPNFFETQLHMARKQKMPREVSKLFKPTATNLLIFLNVITFITTSLDPRIKMILMKIDRRIWNGETYRLLSACFTHGSITHLGFNMYSLHSSGYFTERTFGFSRFLTIYVLSGLLGNIFTYLAGTSPYSLGASGSICGVLGALTMFFYRNKKVLGSQATAALQSLQRNIIMNALYSLPGIGGNIDGAGHLGGFLAGGLLSYLVGPRLQWTEPTPRGNSRYRSPWPGPRVIVDRPLLNYIPLWSRIVGSKGSGLSATVETL